MPSYRHAHDFTEDELAGMEHAGHPDCAALALPARRRTHPVIGSETLME